MIAGSSTERNNEFRIVLSKAKKSEPFGFSVLGGLNSALPVVISEIKRGSIADRCGQLEVGDILTEANGLNFTENSLSTLEVSRYLQAQPNLSLELKIRKDPIIRRKTKEILSDPQDFDRIATAVSPDNLHSLKSLTIQSGHTHKVSPCKTFSSDCGSRSTLSSIRFGSDSKNGSIDGSRSSILTSPGGALTGANYLDYTTDNCLPGYATIRRPPNSEKPADSSPTVLTKSMPTDVHLIGSGPEVYFSNPERNTNSIDRRGKFSRAQTSRRPGSVDDRSLLPEREFRSLSPEIKEAIAAADPSHCWADYFPENVSFNPSSSQHQKTQLSQAVNSQNLSPLFNSTTLGESRDEQTFQTVDLSPQSSEASQNLTFTPPHSMNGSSLTTPPMHKSLNDSFTDEEPSPSQQTQHFNSPVLGATSRTLFFGTENGHSSNQQNSDSNNVEGAAFNSDLYSRAPMATSDSNGRSKGARMQSYRRDSFEKVNLDADEDDDDSYGKCFILESLEVSAPPPLAKPAPEVDLAAARRLASRLFHLNGFDRSDVPKHLGKKQDFSQAVATEYFKFYDFTDERIDASLRRFSSNIFLLGDTQERERILSHFSKRYADCNPNLFPSFESVDYLVTALVLLNQDLNSMRAGTRNSMGLKPMTADQFVTNVITKPHLVDQIPEEYTEYSREMLTELYYSIREEPLMCAAMYHTMQSSMEDDMGYPAMTESGVGGGGGDVADQQRHPTNIDNMASLIPSQASKAVGFTGGVVNNAIAMSFSGYLSRKWLFETDLKKTGKLKRSWKQWYVTLRGFDLIHHKSREEAVKTSGEQKAIVLSLHHALALPLSSSTGDISQTPSSSIENIEEKSSCSTDTKGSFKRKSSVSSLGPASGKWDFSLRLADWAEYQYRCRSKQEMQDWVSTINLIAAFSAPPMMMPISNGNDSSENKKSSSPPSFQRHFKPPAFTNLKFQDQIAMWGSWVNSSEMAHAEAMRKHGNLPPSTNKPLVQMAESEIIYYEFEVQRYQIYQEVLIEALNNARNISASQSSGMSSGHPSAVPPAQIAMQASSLPPTQGQRAPAVVNISSAPSVQQTPNFNPNEVSNMQVGPQKGARVGVSKKPNLSSKAVDYGVL